MTAVNDNERWHAVASLRISSPTWTVDQITLLLKAEPTRSFAKGSLLSPRNPASAVRSQHLICFGSNLDRTRTVEDHLESLALFLESHADAIEALSNSCTLDVFVGVFPASGQGGVLLPHTLVSRFSRFDVDIILDIYPIGEVTQDP